MAGSPSFLLQSSRRRWDRGQTRDTLDLAAPKRFPSFAEAAESVPRAATGPIAAC